jgi:hypothetical protein
MLRSVAFVTSLLTLFASVVAGQESSSATAKTAIALGAADGPTAALRDVLFAACSQNEQSFTKFLTTRNAETFAHLTPTAHEAFRPLE